MNSDFIKELYFKELDGKDQQDARIPLHVGISSILGSILVFTYQNFTSAALAHRVVFYPLLSAALLTYIFALIQILRANLGHVYERLPAADVLYEFFTKLKKFYAEDPKQGLAEEDFTDYLNRKMVSATARNTSVNLTRAARHYSAIRGMAFVLIFALPAWTVTVTLSQQKIAQSETLSLEEESTMTENPGEPTAPQTPAEQPPQTPAEQPSQTPVEKPGEAPAPGRPAEPENVLFKGSRVPPKKGSE